MNLGGVSIPPTRYTLVGDHDKTTDGGSDFAVRLAALVAAAAVNGDPIIFKGGVKILGSPAITLPVDVPNFHLEGDSHRHSYFYLHDDMLTAAGDLDFFLKFQDRLGLWTGQLATYFTGGLPPPPPHNLEIITLKNFGIFGRGTDINGASVARQGGIAFVGRHDNLILDHVEAFNINGTAFHFGKADANGRGGFRESVINRMQVLRCGSETEPAVIIDGQGNTFGPNFATFRDSEISLNRGDGLLIRNASEGNTSHVLVFDWLKMHGTGEDSGSIPLPLSGRAITIEGISADHIIFNSLIIVQHATKSADQYAVNLVAPPLRAPLRAMSSILSAAGTLVAENTFTPAIRIFGSSRSIAITKTGIWVGTLTLQRSTTSATTGFSDVATYTTNAATTYSDGSTAIAWFRIGFKTGGFTSGTADVSLTWAESIDLATFVADGGILDGVALVAGNDFGLKNQIAGSQNGSYTMPASGTPVRRASMDSASEFVGAKFKVTEGASNAGLYFRVKNPVAPVVGTTVITITAFDFGYPENVTIRGSIESCHNGIYVEGGRNCCFEITDMKGIDYNAFEFGPNVFGPMRLALPNKGSIIVVSDPNSSRFIELENSLMPALPARWVKYRTRANIDGRLITLSIIPVPIPFLSISLPAGQTIQFFWQVEYNTDAAADLRYTVSSTVAPAAVAISQQHLPPGAIDWAATITGTVLPASAVVTSEVTGGGTLRIFGTITAGATDGTLSIRCAQGTSHASTTKILPGSLMEMKQLASYVAAPAGETYVDLYPSPTTTVTLATLTQASIRAAIADARTAIGSGGTYNGIYKIKLPAGTWDLSGTADANPIMDFSNIKPSSSGRLVIEGAGRGDEAINTTIISDRDQSPIDASGSGWGRLTLERFHWTRNTIQTSQGVVVSKAAGQIVLDIHPGFPDPETIFDHSFPQGRYLRRYFDNGGPAPEIDTTQDQWAYDSVMLISGSRWQFNLVSGSVPPFSIGDLMGVKSKFASDVLRFTGGIGADVHWLSWSRATRGSIRTTNDFHMTHCRVIRPPPVNGRTPCLTSSEGGMQIGQIVDPYISGAICQDNHIEGTGDDGIAFFHVGNPDEANPDAIIQRNYIEDAFSLRGLMLYQSVNTVVDATNVTVRCTVVFT